MKIKLVYRNYKPIHKIYVSLMRNPPNDVEYICDKPIRNLSALQNFYRKHRSIRAVQFLRRVIESALLSQNNSAIDLFHYINMFPQNETKKPFVIEFEHATGLIGFNNNQKDIKKLEEVLVSGRCIGIIATSEASLDSLRQLIDSKVLNNIKHKCSVIRPTLPIEKDNKKPQDHMKKDKINLLFVGNDSKRKGLQELLIAIDSLSEKQQNKVHLHVISSDGQLIEGFGAKKWLSFYEPIYSQSEILNMFFAPADLFLLPTKQDTYGMVVVDALASGTPVVCTDQFAIPEIVRDGENGILLKNGPNMLDKKLFLDKADRDQINCGKPVEPLIEEIKNLLTKVIKNPSIIKALAEETQKDFKGGGVLDVQTRNSALQEIYLKAFRG